MSNLRTCLMRYCLMDFFNLLEILLDITASTSKIKERAMQYSREHKTEKEVVIYTILLFKEVYKCTKKQRKWFLVV